MASFSHSMVDQKPPKKYKLNVSTSTNQKFIVLECPPKYLLKQSSHEPNQHLSMAQYGYPFSGPYSPSIIPYTQPFLSHHTHQSTGLYLPPPIFQHQKQHYFSRSKPTPTTLNQPPK